jgi:hypothetical protein
MVMIATAALLQTNIDVEHPPFADNFYRETIGVPHLYYILVHPMVSFRCVRIQEKSIQIDGLEATRCCQTRGLLYHTSIYPSEN